MAWLSNFLRVWWLTLFTPKQDVATSESRCLLIAGNIRDYTELDIRHFLQEKAVHLLQFTDFLHDEITTHQFDARMILALIEQQSGLLLNFKSSDQVWRPFGDMHKDSGFEQQTRAVLTQLSRYLQYGSDADVAAYPAALHIRFILQDDLYRLNFDETLQRFHLHRIYNELFDARFADPEPLYDRIFELAPAERRPSELEITRQPKQDKPSKDRMLF